MSSRLFDLIYGKPVNGNVQDDKWEIEERYWFGRTHLVIKFNGEIIAKVMPDWGTDAGSIQKREQAYANAKKLPIIARMAQLTSG